jgi:hypothetical protein
MMKEELDMPANAALREKLEALSAQRAPRRDARGAVVVDRHIVRDVTPEGAKPAEPFEQVWPHTLLIREGGSHSPAQSGRPGNAPWFAPEVIPPMAHLNAHNCQPADSSMRFGAAVSICKLVSAAPSSTSPLGAEIAALKARIAVLEGDGGVVATPAPAKAVQGASEPRSEGVVLTPEQFRDVMHRERWAGVRAAGVADYERVSAQPGGAPAQPERPATAWTSPQLYKAWR